MNEKRRLAEDIAALAVVTVSLVTNAPALAVIPPLMGLVGQMRAKWLSEPRHITKSAVEAVFEGMEQAQEISPALIDDARAALRGISTATQFRRDQLIAAAKKSGALNETLVAVLMAELPKETDYSAQGLIETALAAGVQACTATKDFREALNYELVQELARGIEGLEQGQVRLEAKIDSVSGLLLDLLQRDRSGAEKSGIAFDDLRALASKFGEVTLNDGIALMQFLELKAEEYQIYRFQIDEIDERVAGLGDLKAAAKDAADRLDFEEVDTLLAQVDRVETEVSSHTKELRAKNALLAGKVDAAYLHLSAAADSFQGLEPIGPSRHRIEYAKLLFDHGRIYGGSGLGLAAQMLQIAIAQITEVNNPSEWAEANMVLASVLGTHGDRTKGMEGALLLNQSIASLKAVQSVIKKGSYPLAWAALQQNLGTTLCSQARRITGPQGEVLLLGAIEALRAALEILSEDVNPLEWANTQMNLGTALRYLGSGRSGEGGTDLLAEAVQAYKAALRVFTESGYPSKWATNQMNLGVALLDQGDRAKTQEKRRIFTEPVIAFRAALRIESEDRFPLRWSMTQYNLSLALLQLGNNESGALAKRMELCPKVGDGVIRRRF